MEDKCPCIYSCGREFVCDQQQFRAYLFKTLPGLSNTKALLLEIIRRVRWDMKGKCETSEAEQLIPFVTEVFVTACLRL